MCNTIILFNVSEYKPHGRKVNFLLKEQRLIVSGTNLTFNITYKKYQIIESEKYPKEISISVYDGKNYLQISLDFLKLNFPSKLMLPFKIPDGYKKINLK